MKKEYKELFQVVARNGAINAETVIDMLQKDKEKDHTKDIEVTKIMYDNFLKIEDKLDKDEELDQKDFVQLYAGALVSRNILNRNIETWTAVLNEYNDNIIPKLSEIGKAEDYRTLVDEYFS